MTRAERAPARRRKGEVRGLRWRDWDPSTRPLGCLTVERQYEGRLLKTEHAEGEQTRRVPVHPALAKLLTWRKIEDFELVFSKKPTPTTPSSRAAAARTTPSTPPTRHGGSRATSQASRTGRSTAAATRSSRCAGAAEPGRTSSRRSPTTPRETSWMPTRTGDWTPLCEAVLCLQMRDPIVDANVDRLAQVHEMIVEAPGIELRGYRSSVFE
jgi:hypothetical protein